MLTWSSIDGRQLPIISVARHSCNEELAIMAPNKAPYVHASGKLCVAEMFAFFRVLIKSAKSIY